MSAPQNFAYTLSYDKDKCISVGAGAITIGEVFLKNGVYKYEENSFDLHVSQLYDFILLLKKIAESLASYATSEAKTSTNDTQETVEQEVEGKKRRLQMEEKNKTTGKKCRNSDKSSSQSEDENNEDIDSLGGLLVSSPPLSLALSACPETCRIKFQNTHRMQGQDGRRQENRRIGT